MRWADAAGWKLRHYQVVKHLSNEALERVYDLAEQIATREKTPVVLPRHVNAAFHRWREGQVVSLP